MIFLCDTETTGLLKRGNTDYLAQPGIVQIGALLIAGEDGIGLKGYELEPFTEIDSFVTYVNPEIAFASWEPGAVKTHGITEAQVAGAPTFFAVFDRLAKMAEQADTFSGYHTAFDKDVIWFQLLRYGFEKSFPWPRIDLDVMKLARERMAMEGKRGTKNPKLVEIYEFLFPTKTFGAHDALEDIRATAEVLRELKK